MSKKRKYCLFCGEPDYVRGKEHVFPLWLLEEFELKNYQTCVSQVYVEEFDTLYGFGVTYFPGRRIGFRSELKRQHALSAFVNGGVCKDCNNGWMSELEQEARPILVPLIQGHKHPRDLKKQESFTLALWAMKTAYALHFAVGTTRVNVPISHPRTLLDGDAFQDGRVAVYAGQFRSEMPVDWVSSANWCLAYEDKNPQAISDFTKTSGSHYKISFSILNLHLVVTHLASKDLGILAELGMHNLVFLPANTLFGWFPEISDHPLDEKRGYPPELRGMITAHKHFHFRLSAFTANNPAHKATSFPSIIVQDADGESAYPDPATPDTMDRDAEARDPSGQKG
jgi:hypothetical protein